eukprot:gene11839-5169_t
MNNSVSINKAKIIKNINKRLIIFALKISNKEIEEISAIEIKHQQFTGVHEQIEKYSSTNLNLFGNLELVFHLYGKFKFKNEKKLFFVFDKFDEEHLLKYFSAVKVKLIVSMKLFLNFEDLILKFDKTPCLGLESLYDVDEMINE